VIGSVVVPELGGFGGGAVVGASFALTWLVVTIEVEAWRERRQMRAAARAWNAEKAARLDVGGAEDKGVG